MPNNEHVLEILNTIGYFVSFGNTHTMRLVEDLKKRELVYTLRGVSIFGRSGLHVYPTAAGKEYARNMENKGWLDDGGNAPLTEGSATRGNCNYPGLWTWRSNCLSERTLCHSLSDGCCTA